MMYLTSSKLQNAVDHRNGAGYLGNAFPAPASGSYAWLQPSGWTAGGTTWTDSSGNNRNFTTISGTLSAGTNIGGYKTLNTSGGGIKNTSVSLTGALTVFTVLQAAAVSGVSSRIWETNPGLLCYYPPGPYFRNFFSSNDQNSIAAPSTAGTWSIVANQFGTSSGGLITGSGNGIAYYADTGSTLSSVNGNTFSGAISQIYFGVAADNGAPLQGSIAEILIYASTLNATDYATTLTYLKTKYSIP